MQPCCRHREAVAAKCYRSRRPTGTGAPRATMHVVLHWPPYRDQLGDLRVPLVRENLPNRVLRYFRYFRLETEDVHVSSYSLVNRPEFSNEFSACPQMLFIAAISSSSGQISISRGNGPEIRSISGSKLSFSYDSPPHFRKIIGMRSGPGPWSRLCSQVYRCGMLYVHQLREPQHRF